MPGDGGPTCNQIAVQTQKHKKTRKQHQKQKLHTAKTNAAADTQKRKHSSNLKQQPQGTPAHHSPDDALGKNPTVLQELPCGHGLAGTHDQKCK
jgi:hypothetical protein